MGESAHSQRLCLPWRVDRRGTTAEKGLIMDKIKKERKKEGKREEKGGKGG